MNHIFIYEKKLIGWICFYSYIGSFIYNNFLRINKLDYINPTLLKGLEYLIENTQNTPQLNKKYSMYRFIRSDKFLKNLKIDDVYTEFGFTSLTRDPFYKPGEIETFGLILLKINIDTHIKGGYLFIENYSLFPMEQEFLIFPYAQFKLISKEDNIKYFHTNENIEKRTIKKYEIDFIGCDIIKYKNILNDITYNIKKFNHTNIITNINTISLIGNDRMELLKDFISKYSENYKFNIKIKDNIYLFSYTHLRLSASYAPLHYNNIGNGYIFFIYNDNGYVELNIEMGNEMIVNYLNQYYYGISYKEMSNEYIDIIYSFAKIFFYKKVKIYHTFKSLYDFKDNYEEHNRIFLSFNLYNHTIYNYIKNNKKYEINDPYIKYDIGYDYLDFIFDKVIENRNLPTEIINCYTYRQFFIKSIENNFFHMYKILMDTLDPTIKNKQYMTFYVYDKLKDSNQLYNFNSNIEHDSTI